MLQQMRPKSRRMMTILRNDQTFQKTWLATLASMTTIMVFGALMYEWSASQDSGLVWALKIVILAITPAVMLLMGAMRALKTHSMLERAAVEELIADTRQEFFFYDQDLDEED